MEKGTSPGKAASEKAVPDQAMGDTAFMADSKVNEPKSRPEPKKLAQTEEFAMQPNDKNVTIPSTGQGTDVPDKSAALNQTAAFDDKPPPPPKPAAAPKPAAKPEQKATILGDYKLLNKLGQGGMGSVYKAQQMSLERDVALKILAKELANKKGFVDRFKREAKVMAKLDHPNILRCYGAGQHGDYHFLAMEFVDGGSVEGWLKKQGKFNLGDATYVMICCLNALQHAHELNLIHRDIKPDNILLTKKGVIKVADLGLAKATDDDMSLTQTGTGAGTPLYMAPEQARDVKNVDNRTDIFALGCMYYCLLAGEPPFKGETLLEVIEAKEKGRYTALRKVNDEVPEKLELIIDKMIAKKPEHRYPDCASVVQALEELGFANDRLSFIDGALTAPKAPGSSSGVGRLSGVGKIAGATSTPAPASRSGSPGVTAKPTNKTEAGYWFVTLVADGKPIRRKLPQNQVEGLIKSKMINAETEVSKTLEGGYRALGTFGEFLHLLKSNALTDKVDKKGDKLRKMVDNIDKEVASRKRWRWFNDFMNKSGKMIGGALWIFIVVLVIAAAGYFIVKFVTSNPPAEPPKTKGKKAEIEWRAPAFASSQFRGAGRWPA